MTAQDYARTHLNRSLDNGQGGFAGECLSLVIRFVHDVYNVPYGVLYASKTEGIRDLYEQYDGQIPQYFDRLPISEAKPGDLIIWGSLMGKYGHGGVVIDPNTGTVFEQLGTPVFIKSRIHSYPLSTFKQALGVLRFKGGTMQDKETIAALTKQRDEVAEQLIKAEKLVEAVTKQRDTVTQKLIDTEIELEKANKKIDELSKSLAVYQLATYKKDQSELEATAIGTALIKLFQSFGYKKS